MTSESVPTCIGLVSMCLPFFCVLQTQATTSPHISLWKHTRVMDQTTICLTLNIANQAEEDGRFLSIDSQRSAIVSRPG
ncbi:hypothetical protein V1509DRAFT_620295 [Lipomyces kononenkoae]